VNDSNDVYREEIDRCVEQLEESAASAWYAFQHGAIERPVVKVSSFDGGVSIETVIARVRAKFPGVEFERHYVHIFRDGNGR
jgi:hypothetical protein